MMQLGGDDPELLAEAVCLVIPFAYDEINLNCGCPSVETGGANYGASLMVDPRRTATLVEALLEAAGDVSKRALPRWMATSTANGPPAVC